jgi:hypothetical protein
MSPALSLLFLEDLSSRGHGGGCRISSDSRCVVVSHCFISFINKQCAALDFKFFLFHDFFYET